MFVSFIVMTLTSVIGEDKHSNFEKNVCLFYRNDINVRHKWRWKIKILKIAHYIFFLVWKIMQKAKKKDQQPFYW